MEGGPLNPAYALVGVILVVLAVLIGRPLWRARQRRRVRARPMSEEWRAIVASALPVYHRLPDPLRLRLDGLIQQFIAEKEFIGCRGLEVTLEMKLTIAAYACLLIANRSSRVYEALYSILLYPTAFIVPEEEQDEAGVITAHESILSGQAWETHRIILSWDDIEAGLRDKGSGYNVVLHEFAHYLDAEDGGANGAPWLSDAADYTRWSQVMTEEYERLITADRRGEETVLDPYGAEDPAEFFAVATETFFERPVDLKIKHSALYAELAAYYRVDPAAWYLV